MQLRCLRWITLTLYYSVITLDLFNFCLIWFLYLIPKINAFLFYFFSRIGEIEARRNVFLVEREAKASLFRQSNSPTASRTVSLDEGPPSPTVSENSHSSGSTISSNNSFCLHHPQASFPSRKAYVLCFFKRYFFLFSVKTRHNFDFVTQIFIGAKKWNNLLTSIYIHIILQLLSWVTVHSFLNLISEIWSDPTDIKRKNIEAWRSIFSKICKLPHTFMCSNYTCLING